MRIVLVIVAIVAAAYFPHATRAQHASGDHAGHAMADTVARSALPTRPGQDAYGAIAEIVALLEADPATDWSRVDLESLRQHLIDMNEVTLRSVVVRRAVPAGVQMDATGDSRTSAALRRMVRSHARALAESPRYDARVEDIPGGTRLTVNARDAADSGLVQKIRGLGFIGMMTSENHHARHHLALARGDGSAHAH